MPLPKPTATLSTAVEDVSVETLQQHLDAQRNFWLEGYLTKDFAKIERVLSPAFHCINGKQLMSKDEWQNALNTIWQSRWWAAKPLMPDRTRYHFFSPSECVITLYFMDKHANVMQEMWMKDADRWQFNTLSTITR